MKAVILAAGVGHRFKELTKYKNKAFFTIGQTMVIKQIIQYLLQAGIRDITIVTGHRHKLASVRAARNSRAVRATPVAEQ